MTKEYDVLLFSDHHAHNHKYGSKRREHNFLPGLFNSRLLDACAVLDEITAYLKEHPEIRIVIFGGDMFHIRGNVPMDVLALTHISIRRMAEVVDHMFMLPGNHDYEDREGKVHALEIFEGIPGVHVISSPTKKELCPGLTGFFVPYSDDKKVTLEAMQSFLVDEENTNIFVGHTGFKGAKVGSDFVLINESDLSIKEFESKNYDASFFGHFHKHQTLAKNCWYIGATHQHNWGDCEDERGFVHAKISKDSTTVKHVKTNAPQFVKITKKAQLKEDHSRDYCRILLSLSDTAKEKAIKSLNNPVVFEVVVPAETKETEDEEFELPEDTLDPMNMVQFWTDMQGKSEELAALGKEILAEAEGGV